LPAGPRTKRWKGMELSFSDNNARIVEKFQLPEGVNVRMTCLPILRIIRSCISAAGHVLQKVKNIHGGVIKTEDGGKTWKQVSIKG